MLHFVYSSVSVKSYALTHTQTQNLPQKYSIYILFDIIFPVISTFVSQSRAGG